MFSDFDIATRALLLTTCEAISDASTEFVIVGGWVPLLRGGGNGLAHPGTRDVDILFGNKDPEIVRPAAEALLKRGFTPSAKHEFQLLRSIEVGNQDFIFNVDLMHPAEQSERPELFCDIFDLGVIDLHDPTGKRWMKSIVFESAQVIFDKSLWSFENISGQDISGAPRTVSVPLMNEAALVLSKTKSVRQVKRPRDSFDIFYVMTGPKREEIVSTIISLTLEFEEINRQLQDFLEWLSKDKKTFNKNVHKYAPNTLENPTQFILSSFAQQA
jgi:hypothetical protein